MPNRGDFHPLKDQRLSANSNVTPILIDVLGLLPYHLTTLILTGADHSPTDADSVGCWAPLNKFSGSPVPRELILDILHVSRHQQPGTTPGTEG